MTARPDLESLSRYVDDDLESREREHVEDALAHDAELRLELDELRVVIADLGALHGAAAPEHLAGRIAGIARIEAERKDLWARGQRAIERHVLSSSFLPMFAVVIALGAIFYVLASGVARVDPDRTRLVVAPADAVATPVEMADRRFVPTGERWIQVGIAGREPTRVLEGGELDAFLQRHQRLAELRKLRVVVAEVGGEVVELVFAQP